MIFHVASMEDWVRALEQGSYVVSSLEDEGFIHCSQKHQISGVLERFFKHKHNLVLLHIDEKKLRANVLYEAGVDVVGEKFPHVYGPIGIDAVVHVEPLQHS